MEAWAIVLIAVGAVALLVFLLFSGFFVKNRESNRLRTKFGSEYDRTVSEYGDKKSAEKELAEREKRVERLRLQPLSADDRRSYLERWKQTQARFVDDPSGAIVEADSLLTEVMGKRGYPVGNFERQSADVSVEHPQLVQNYLAAHEISQAVLEVNRTRRTLGRR